MCQPVPVDRNFPDGSANERQVLTGFLDWQRATVHRKVTGLSAESTMRVMLKTSPRMTVAGIVSHLRYTEHRQFSVSFPSLAEPSSSTPADDGGWNFGGRELPELLHEYDVVCRHSRRIVNQVDLDTMQEFTPPQYEPVSVRWMLTHMIEETARHLGHLDILREQLDGVCGY